MKRATLFFLIFILVGWVFVPASHAQSINVAPSAEEMGTIVDQKSQAGQMSKEVYTVNTQALYLNSAVCFTVGCSSDPASQLYYGNSVIAYIDKTMVAMYQTPPADLALWIHSTAQTLGFEPKQAYAQGIGFSGLAPLLPLWQAFRNLAYALLAVVMIVIGFMVMFRKKIDPKTVVTVQNALPRIVVTLLLITFSYAIVGFMIDLMYLVLLLAISALVAASKGSLATNTANQYLTGGFWVMLKGIFGGSIKSLDDVLAFFTPGTVAAGAGGLIGLGFIGALIAGASATGGTAPLVAAAVPILALVILAIVIVFAVIRLFFLLVGAYIQIIISLLIGPLQLLLGALPGNNAFGTWFTGLLSNLMVFPLTAVLILIANILASLEVNPLGSTTKPLWTPPVLGGTGHGVAGLIAIGMLLSIPSIVNGLKEALKVKPIVSVGAGGITGAAGAIGQYGFQYIMSKRMENAYKDSQIQAQKTANEGKTPPSGQT
jgi:hypothetical protein